MQHAANPILSYAGKADDIPDQLSTIDGSFESIHYEDRFMPILTALANKQDQPSDNASRRGSGQRTEIADRIAAMNSMDDGRRERSDLKSIASDKGFIAQESYWRTVHGFEPSPLILPTDRPRPVQQSFDAAQHLIRIDASLKKALITLSYDYDLSLANVLIAGWSVVLSRLSGQTDITIGYSGSNSTKYMTDRQEVANALPLRINLSEHPTTTQLLDHLQGANNCMKEHNGFPIHKAIRIMQYLRPLPVA
ncbi:hypothetical protein BC939DRAFT_522130 [Gamsiella multidivaricata]|uniref:uncharacterized protein n=1 Tax=Gamsiella multidivaricata TaxID=101098 RepID=UPI00221EF600|nr:uncharacterized protein BC939DRAFT_522130 [Gamsiella multidivaricata]KAI7818444.1 hypothetical protein BC939DRAFT_522130 [Gamsiella multidivaricata]